MAHISPNVKDGKVVSFKFKVFLGRDKRGKQTFTCTTWRVPDGLSPAKAQKAAEKATAQWERELREGPQKELAPPERIKQHEIERTRTEFSFVRLSLRSYYKVYKACLLTLLFSFPL